MDINQILQQEDEAFNQRHSMNEQTTAKTSKSKKNIDKNMNTDDMRDMIMDELTGGKSSEESSFDVITKEGKPLNENELKKDIKEIFIKYGLKPNSPIALQIMGTFIKNLYSAKLIKKEFK